MIEDVSSPLPEHVYVGYWVREKGDEPVCEPFAVKAKTFKKAKEEVETGMMAEFSVHASGVAAAFYLQETRHELIALKNVKAFFNGPSKTDIHVGDVVPTSEGGSKIVLAPKKASKPRTLKEKDFLGYCLLNGTQIPLVIRETGYMKARERVFRLASAVSHDHPSLSLSFYIRNQEIEAGEKAEELLRTPWKSECLVRINPTKNGPKFEFPNQLNRKYRPHQGEKDRDTFMDDHLDRLVESIRKEVARALEKERTDKKIRT